MAGGAMRRLAFGVASRTFLETTPLLTHGAPSTDRRTSPNLDPHAKRPLVVGKCLSRRSAAAHHPLGGHGLFARRYLVGDGALHRRKNGHQYRRGPDVGDSGVRAFSWAGEHRHREGFYDSGEQLYAVDRDGGGLYDHPPRLEYGCVHVGDGAHRAVVAVDRVERGDFDPRRVGGVSAQAAIYQRGSVAVSRRPGLWRGARHALHGEG